jgi:hypothetical protein
VGYFPLRLLSLVSTLASVGLIFWIVWHATRARVCFSAVLTDDGLVVNDLVERFYRRDHLGGDHRALVPKTGPTYRPRNLYVPR